MRKTEELKKQIIKAFSDRCNWNRRIQIGDEVFVYMSAMNSVRREVHQPSGTILSPVGCFVFVGNESPLGNFMWCC